MLLINIPLASVFPPKVTFEFAVPTTTSNIHKPKVKITYKQDKIIIGNSASLFYPDYCTKTVILIAYIYF